MMTTIFLSFLEISISMSFIVAALILLTSFFNKRYTAKWKYLIWIFLAVRLLIPIHGTDVKSFMDRMSPMQTQTASKSEEKNTDTPTDVTTPPRQILVEIPSQMTTPIANAFAMPSEEESISITVLDIVAYVWLIGSFIFMSVHLLSYLTYKTQVLKKGTTIKNPHIWNQMIEHKQKLQIKCAIRMIEYPEADSPMIIGFFKPVLVLPEEQYSTEELFFILKHELIHLKRGDVFWKLLFVTANAVHWFNPLIWMMQKEAAVDMELSCDESVTKGTDYEMRKAYTETLFSAFQKQCSKKTALSTQFYGGKKIMKKRFQNILLNNRKKNGMFLLSFVMILTISLGTLVSCSTVKEKDEEISKPVEQSTEKADNLPTDGEIQDSKVSAAYEKLIAYKTENYAQQSIADFNAALASTPDELSELLSAQADVSVAPDDANYDFIATTTYLSAHELYCAHRGEEVAYNAAISKQSRPIKIAGETVLDEDGEIAYDFYCSAELSVVYTIKAPERLTVAERDNTLLTFKKEMQDYLNGLSEDEITDGNFKMMLTDKATELENSLSTEKIELSCEIYLVEIINAGTETVL